MGSVLSLCSCSAPRDNKNFEKEKPQEQEEKSPFAKKVKKNCSTNSFSESPPKRPILIIKKNND